MPPPTPSRPTARRRAVARRWRRRGCDSDAVAARGGVPAWSAQTAVARQGQGPAPHRPLRDEPAARAVSRTICADLLAEDQELASRFLFTWPDPPAALARSPTAGRRATTRRWPRCGASRPWRVTPDESAGALASTSARLAPSMDSCSALRAEMSQGRGSRDGLAGQGTRHRGPAGGRPGPAGVVGAGLVRPAGAARRRADRRSAGCACGRTTSARMPARCSITACPASASGWPAASPAGCAAAGLSEVSREQVRIEALQSPRRCRGGRPGAVSPAGRRRRAARSSTPRRCAVDPPTAGGSIRGSTPRSLPEIPGIAGKLSRTRTGKPRGKAPRDTLSAFGRAASGRH